MKERQTSLQVKGFQALLHIDVGCLKSVPVSLKTTILGKFAHSKVKCSIGGRFYSGEGISRRSYKDTPNDDKAHSISSGRAIKSLEKKILGKKVNNILMA